MKLKISFFAVLMLLFVHAGAQKVTYNFIDRFLPLVQDLKQEWGIPISIILGVSILESGSGTSLNAKQLNNFFGITGKNHLKHRRTAYKQYATPKESFENFCQLMSSKKFYPKLKGDMNYHTWLAAMNKANYAGAKGVWITRIKSIIQKQKLYLYDK